MVDSEIFTVERTQVFGHRGARKYAPQNTLPAFKLAAEMGCDGIELDVHLTTDGALVIIHDDDVEGTTNGTGEVSEIIAVVNALCVAPSLSVTLSLIVYVPC